MVTNIYGVFVVLNALALFVQIAIAGCCTGHVIGWLFMTNVVVIVTSLPILLICMVFDEE